MKFLVCICLLLYINAVRAQNKIFYKVDDLNDTTANNNIAKIKMPWGNLGNNVLIICDDASKIKLQKKNIWGIEKNNIVLRLNEANTLELIDTSAVIIYKTYARHPVYYFSKSLNSKAIVLSRKNVMKAFDINRFPQVYKKSLMLRQVLSYTDDFKVSVSSFNN